MEMSVAKKKSFHPFWFILAGSSLYYFKSELVSARERKNRAHPHHMHLY
jgi:hypothetical protein